MFLLRLSFGYLQADQEISAYAHERTLKLAERVKLLKDLKLANKELQLQVSHNQFDLLYLLSLIHRQ